MRERTEGTKGGKPKPSSEATAPLPGLTISADDWQKLRHFDHAEPHRVLGAHPLQMGGQSGVVVRAFHPDAVRAECIFGDGRSPHGRSSGDKPLAGARGSVKVEEPLAGARGSYGTLPDGRGSNKTGGMGIEMVEVEEGGLFATFIPEATLPSARQEPRPPGYRLRFTFADGNTWERGDPYRFPPTFGELDQHLFNEGKHRRLWECMGAHARKVDGQHGVAFAVWAPNARRVSVVGDFCAWDGRLFPMRTMGSSGVFELFIPDLVPGDLYKFEIKTQEGALRIKTDPFGREMEGAPNHASRVTKTTYERSEERRVGKECRSRWSPYH